MYEGKKERTREQTNERTNFINQRIQTIKHWFIVKLWWLKLNKNFKSEVNNKLPNLLLFVQWFSATRAAHS